jgi:hypothetical protein
MAILEGRSCGRRSRGFNECNVHEQRDTQRDHRAQGRK